MPAANEIFKIVDEKLSLREMALHIMDLGNQVKGMHVDINHNNGSGHDWCVSYSRLDESGSMQAGTVYLDHPRAEQYLVRSITDLSAMIASSIET